MILSILLIIVAGLLSGFIFKLLKLPGLLGMILAGVVLGPYGLNQLDPSILDNSSDIRMLALIIILLRAGLGLNKDVLKSVGRIAFKMSAIPCLVEGFTVMLISYIILDIPLVEAGMLGFIIAAVSPAVVVPSMLYLKENMLGMKKGVPIIVLAGASVDDVFAITLFTAFLSMSMQADNNFIRQIALIPIQIAGGIALGVVFGFLLYKIYLHRSIRLTDMERLAFVLVGAFGVLIIGEAYHMAGLLGVMTLGFILLEKANGIAVQIERKLNKVWFFAQIFLFVLIGAEVNIHVALQGGMAGLVIVAVGLLARSIGVFIALYRSHLNLKERLFCAIAYSPKATVQAAIGGIPLAMGIKSGPVILAVAVLAVVITAPLGAIGIKLSAPRLLEKDEEGASMM